MIYTIENKNKINPTLLKIRVMNSARRRILKYPTNAAEYALNTYCIEHYQMSLKHVCLKLLFGAVKQVNHDKNLIFIFPNKNLDNMAKLITYGTGKIKGSQILNAAFTY